MAEQDDHEPQDTTMATIHIRDTVKGIEKIGEFRFPREVFERLKKEVRDGIGTTAVGTFPYTHQSGTTITTRELVIPINDVAYIT